MKLKEKSKMLRRAAYVAFPHSAPILAGYGFLGLAYGILMSVNGFSPFFTFMMSAVVFGGSIQIVAVELLTAAVHLWKKQMLLSISAGMVCYMLLVQFVF